MSIVLLAYEIYPHRKRSLAQTIYPHPSTLKPLPGVPPVFGAHGLSSREAVFPLHMYPLSAETFEPFARFNENYYTNV